MGQTAKICLADLVFPVYLYRPNPNSSKNALTQAKKNEKLITFFKSIIIQIAKRFDSLNAQMPPTNDHFKRHSVTYE